MGGGRGALGLARGLGQCQVRMVWARGDSDGQSGWAWAWAGRRGVGRGWAGRHGASAGREGGRAMRRPARDGASGQLPGTFGGRRAVAPCPGDTLKSARPAAPRAAPCCAPPPMSAQHRATLSAHSAGSSTSRLRNPAVCITPTTRTCAAAAVPAAVRVVRPAHPTPPPPPPPPRRCPYVLPARDQWPAPAPAPRA